MRPALLPGAAVLVSLAGVLLARDAVASPLFELAGSTTGDGGFNAGVTGESSSATYFNPALLPYAPQSFETGTVVLTDQISVILDGRAGGDVPLVVGDRALVGADGRPISNATVPTPWLENGCTPQQCQPPLFRKRPRQAAGSSGQVRAYQVIGLVSHIVPKRLVLGLHALVPLGTFTTARSFYNDEREQFFSNSLHPELFGDRMTATSIAFGPGVKIAKNLSIGLSFTLNLTNDAQAATYVRSSANYDQLLVDTNVGVKAAVAAHGGVAWRPVERLRLAATFHQEQKFVIATGIKAALPSGQESETTRTQVHDFVPWTVGLGGTVEVAKRERHTISVAGSLKYAAWSRYLDRHGDSPAVFGPRFAWKDTLSPTVGLRHASGGMREYLDVTYVPSPVPEQSGRSSYVDSDRAGLTIGADYTFEAAGLKWRPGLSLQGHKVLHRYNRKTDALVLDEVPDDAVDAQTRLPVPGARGLQTNNPGWPGFASEGWVYGGAATIAVIY